MNSSAGAVEPTSSRAASRSPSPAKNGSGEPLRWHHAEREARVDQRVAEPFGRGNATFHERVEAGPPRVGKTLLEGVEGLPFIEVWHVDGVTCLAQLGREGFHSFCQPVSVVVQHKLGHGLSLSNAK